MTRKKRIVILGSTGSVGENAVRVAKQLKERIEVVGVAARSSIKKLAAQAADLGCKWAAVEDETLAADLKAAAPAGCKILSGKGGLVEMASLPECDMVLCSISGSAGLRPTLGAIEAGKDVALATKEALVMCGEIVMGRARAAGIKLLPVDSEHSAIFQCLDGKKPEDVAKLILTASGGPFKDATRAEMEAATCKMALSHPTWSMGPKITIDSATLMNKALEIIEARWLFDITGDKIEAMIHPQSIIHSMVEFVDGAVLAQMSPPDMRFPIQHALTYPERLPSPHERMDFSKYSSLTFEIPDKKKFPSLEFAFHALREGGTMPAAMNAANEAAVERFRKGQIRLTDIWTLIERVMESHKTIRSPGLEEVFAADAEARKKASQLEI